MLAQLLVMNFLLCVQLVMIIALAPLSLSDLRSDVNGQGGIMKCQLL